MNTDALRDIYRINLAVAKGERVLVFTDRVNPKERTDISPAELSRRNSLRDIAKAAATIGRTEFPLKEVLYKEYTSRGGPAKEPPEAIWRAAMGDKTVDALVKEGLFKEITSKKITDDRLEKAGRIIEKGARGAVEAVIALSNWSTSHTIFRKLLTSRCGTRYASMPLFDASMLEGPMRVNYRLMRKLARLVASSLKQAHTVEVKAPNGTSLTFRKDKRPITEDAGDLRKPGSFGNLPAGEVYFAPLEGTAEGQLVIEWGPTRKLESPVTVSIKNGAATDIFGDEPFAAELKGRLAENPMNPNLAELGIGINDMASRPDNILESEKILGTAHIALGANITFGGVVKAPYHQDFVLFNPSVTLYLRSGGVRVLIDNGKLDVSA